MNLILPFVPFIIFLFLDEKFPLDYEWYQKLNHPTHLPDQQMIYLFWSFTLLVFGIVITLTNSDWLLLTTILFYYYIHVFRNEKDLQKSFWVLLAVNLALSVHLIKFENQAILIPSALGLFYFLYTTYLTKQTNRINN